MNIVYNQFKTQLARGAIDLVNDNVYVALLTDTYTPNPDDDSFSTLSAHESSGSGYTTGGQLLSNKTVTEDDVNDRMVFTADNVVWSTATVSARYAVIYDGNLAGSNDLIALVDFGSTKSSDNGDYIVQWDSEGILTLS